MLKMIETTQAEAQNARLKRKNSRREVWSKIQMVNSEATNEVTDDSDQTMNMLSNWIK